MIPMEAEAILQERFGHDCLIALATIHNGKPAVRTVDALYMEGAFYVITHALSGKMQQLAAEPHAAVCGEWFTGNAIGENLGHVCAPENAAIAARLREAFAAWYGNGHVDEADTNTCILRLQMTDGVLMKNGVRYELQF